MGFSSKSLFPDEESDDDNFLEIQGGDLNSADHDQFLTADHDGASTSSEHQTQKLIERTNSDDLTQKLIVLSNLVPGPNEIDEATVLTKTINYVKELQEIVNMLEDQSVPADKKAKVRFCDREAGSDDTTSSHQTGKMSGYFQISTSGSSLPDIDARFSDKDVIIHIHCRNSKGLLINILNHLGNLHLSVVQNNVLRFGSSHIDITVAAQMEDGFAMTVKELTTSLRMAFSSSF